MKYRRQDAQGQSNHHSHQHGAHHQFNGGRQPLQNQFGHRPSGVKGLPHVAGQGLPQVADVLLHKRPVQTQLFPQLFPVRRQGLLTQHQIDRIAGNKMNEKEYEGQYAEHDRQGPQQPAQQISHWTTSVFIRACWERHSRKRLPSYNQFHVCNDNFFAA